MKKMHPKSLTGMHPRMLTITGGERDFKPGTRTRWIRTVQRVADNGERASLKLAARLRTLAKRLKTVETHAQLRRWLHDVEAVDSGVRLLTPFLVPSGGWDEYVIDRRNTCHHCGRKGIFRITTHSSLLFGWKGKKPATWCDKPACRRAFRKLERADQKKFPAKWLRRIQVSRRDRYRPHRRSRKTIYSVRTTRNGKVDGRSRR